MGSRGGKTAAQAERARSTHAAGAGRTEAERALAFVPSFDELAYPDTALASGVSKEDAACVVSLDRGYPLLRFLGGLERAEHTKAFVAKDALECPTIGDWVVYEPKGSHDCARIQRVLPRKNTLFRSRRSAVQALAANVDQFLYVQPLDHPRGALERVGRGLVLAQASGVPARVLFSKADLCKEGDEGAELIAEFCEVFPKVPFSVISWDGQGIEDVKASLLPKTVSVVCGSSGAGKSTLINTLLGEAVLETQEVRKKDAAGRHTTVARRMLSLPDGGSIIDCPGMRTIPLAGLKDGVDALFFGISSLEGCEFRDCTHTAEKRCAVKEAVALGKISQKSYKIYQTFVQESSL